MTRKIGASDYLPYICFWALTLLNLIGITTHAAFIPVLQCPDVDFDQASGFKCSASNHKLHCILEKDACQPGLVCLPWNWLKTNKCPIYSKSTAGMKYHPCIGDNTQCPYNVTYYKSFKANKYPGCYVCENKLPTTTTTVETKSDKTTTETKSLYTKHQLGVLTEAPPVTSQTLENNRSSDLPTYVYVLIPLLIIVLLNIIFIVLFRKQISKMLKRHICCNNTEKKNRYERKISRKNEENSLTQPSCIIIEVPEIKNTTEWNAPESEKIDDTRSPEKVPMVDSGSPEKAPMIDSGSPEGAILIDLQTECSADENEEGKDIEYCAKQSEDAPVQNDEAELEEEAETMLSEPCDNRSKSSKEMKDLKNQRKLNININQGIDQMNKDPNEELLEQVERRDNPGFDQ